MRVESLLTTILFESGPNSYMFDNKGLLEKARLQEEVNDIRTDNYSIYQIYPQPKPSLRTDGFAIFEHVLNAQVKSKRRKRLR